jgi:hypothetical protein
LNAVIYRAMKFSNKCGYFKRSRLKALLFSIKTDNII